MTELKYKLLEIVDSSLERNEITEWEYNCLFKLINLIKHKICGYDGCSNERDKGEYFCYECRSKMCTECDRYGILKFNEHLLCERCFEEVIESRFTSLENSYFDEISQVFNEEARKLKPFYFLGNYGSVTGQQIPFHLMPMMFGPMVTVRITMR